MISELLSDNNAASYYDDIQKLRNEADYHERRLIRFLRHEAVGCNCRRDGRDGHTWAHVAELTGAGLTRQGAQAKWSRLVNPARRRPGEGVRGGRQATDT